MKSKSTREQKLAERYQEIAKLYAKHGTAVGVAEALGVSRQHAAMLLSQADLAGVLTYVRREKKTVTKAQARAALRERGGIVAAAAALGMSDATFRVHFPDLVEEFKKPKRMSAAECARLAKARAASAAQRAKARAAGICTGCFVRPAGEGRVTCPTCSAAAVARRDRLKNI